MFLEHFAINFIMIIPIITKSKTYPTQWCENQSLFIASILIEILWLLSLVLFNVINIDVIINITLILLLLCLLLFS